MPKLTTVTANIDIRPESVSTEGVREITIGDLHANAIKFLYFLIREGICEMSAEDYIRAVAIYKSPVDSITPIIRDEFSAILSRMTIRNSRILVRLIGDEMADRGSNDYFILKILKRLQDPLTPVSVQILLSNHSYDFIESYEKLAHATLEFDLKKAAQGGMSLPTTIEKPKLQPGMLSKGGFAQSFLNLLRLIHKDIVSLDEITTLIDTVYKPSLALFGYTRGAETNEMTLFSHAPSDLNAIAMAASRFGVDYKDDTVFELARTIDAINSRYLVFVMTNTVHTLCNPSMLYKGFQYSEWDMIPHAETAIIEFIMWNREWSILGLPDTHKGYKLYYSHGHHPETAPFGHVFNLDNMLGKSYDLHIGEYQILIDTVPVPVAEAASEAASAADAVFPTTAPLSATTAPLTFFSAPLTSTHPGEKDLVPEGDAEPTFFSPLLYDF